MSKIKGHKNIGMGDYRTQYYIGLCCVVLLTIYVTAKSVLMMINVPVSVGMAGELVNRTPVSVVLEVTGYKIRDCKLDMHGFNSWYYNDDGRGVREGGDVSFPYDAKPGNSRPRGVLTKYNFGLFKFDGIPTKAKYVRVSSEHWCTVDGVIIKVTSISPLWDIAVSPNTTLFKEYLEQYKYYDAFKLPIE